MLPLEEFSGATSGGRWLKSGDANGAQLVRSGPSLSVFLPKAGTANLRFKFLVKLTGDVAKRQIAFAIRRRRPVSCRSAWTNPKRSSRCRLVISLKTATAVGVPTGRSSGARSGQPVEFDLDAAHETHCGNP